MVSWYRIILFCQYFSLVWNHCGDLRSHGLVWTWDSSSLIFHIFVLRLQWAKKLGWLFLAVGGRSSMENDCWLQCWVALTLGISYGSHPLTSYIFLYLPTCFFCFNGCHAQRPVTCQSLGQLGPSEIRRAQAYWHRGFESLHRDREEGKNRKDCFGYRKRTLKIHEYTWIYVHITYMNHESEMTWRILKIFEKSLFDVVCLCLSFV